MAKRRALSWGLGIGAVVLLVFVGVFLFLWEGPRVSIAMAFDPGCKDGDEACQVWTTFRVNHPYPYQSFASARLKGGRVLLVASEPPPDVSHGQAIGLFMDLFADRAPRVATRRWLTGADGYVEDLLVEFDAPEMKSNDLLEAPTLRDRVALLGLAWYGTSYGVDVEPIQHERLKRTAAIAPNLHVTAAELRTWLSDIAISWSAIEDENTVFGTWAELASAGSIGAFRSTDGTLVLLTFPKALLDNSRGLQTLKAAFRRYAAASDATVGAVWTDGQVAFIGRGRTHSLTQIPPLRFETFSLLAAQRSDTLSQSYERANAMAGKLINADFVDWAPIYLSPALQDTEFGSLLDITDQMLKSWSEAGHIDYLYFDYPLRPDHFPFDRPLSEEVRAEQKNSSTSVLFNWNTTGSAVVLNDGTQKLLTVHSLGSLPITYGSELEPGGPTTTGHLTVFEEKAYAYFSDLGDPSLARVVQYTLMYQTFRAIAPPEGTTGRAALPNGPSSPGADVLIRATRTFLAKLESGHIEPPADWPISGHDLAEGIDAARTKLTALRSHQPDMSLDRLAILLADPRRDDPVFTSQQRQLSAGAETLSAAERRLKTDEEAFQARAGALKSEMQGYLGAHSKDETLARFRTRVDELKRRKEDLDQRRAALQEKFAPYEQLAADHNEVEAFREALNSIVMASQDLRPVRTAYSQANAHDVDGWIHTPSFVTSQNSQTIESVGGHNLDARAIRLVPDRSVADLQIVDGPEGRQLLYNPDTTDVANHAAEISRAIEHNDANVATLKGIVATPRAPRARAAALDIQPEGKTPRWSARLGMKGFTSNDVFASELRSIKTQTQCCRVLAKDANDVLYLAETNAKPPPAVRVATFGDTASFGNYMRSHGGLDDVIVFDQPLEHVQAIFAGLDIDTASPSRFDVLKAAARRLIGRSEPSDHLLLVDMRGRRGSIDVPRGSGAEDERAKQIALLATKRTGGAHIEPLTSQQVRDIVGGVDWRTSEHGAPSVVRVRFSGSKGLDVVAGFRTGDAVTNQQLLDATVARSVALSDQSTRIMQLQLTIKLDLEALPPGRLGKVLFVLREEGGAKMQLTLAPSDVDPDRG